MNLLRPVGIGVPLLGIAGVLGQALCQQYSTTTLIAHLHAGGYGAMRPKMHMILHTLLEVAVALRHVHGLQLAHCDVKPANVLLKTSATDQRCAPSKQLAPRAYTSHTP
jgi:hypothetical protein